MFTTNPGVRNRALEYGVPCHCVDGGKSSLQPLLISALQPLVSSALKKLVNSTRMLWSKLKFAGKFKELKRSLRRSSSLGERTAKFAVIGVFTVFWLLIVLVRSHGVTDPTALE